MASTLKERGNNMLTTYEAFKSYLEDVGFMTLSNNKAGVPSLSSLTLEEQWHTNEDDDPWVWRQRIALDKVAGYGKFFDKKPAFITLEWFPYFLATRRGSASVDIMYAAGRLSHTAKRLYDLFKENREVATHDVKALLGQGPGKTECENALTELQMGMFLTVSGVVRKTNAQGLPYGWPSVCLMKTEEWVGEAVMKQGASLDQRFADAHILAKARQHNPSVDEKQLKKLLGV